MKRHFLIELRKKSGLNQLSVAEKFNEMGMGRSTQGLVFQYESGTIRVVNPIALKVYAEISGVLLENVVLSHLQYEADKIATQLNIKLPTRSFPSINSCKFEELLDEIKNRLNGCTSVTFGYKSCTG